MGDSITGYGGVAESRTKMVEPVVGIIHNLKLERWHPVLFSLSPLPGNSPETPMRWKSYGHHTEGFGSREEAIASASDMANRLKDNSIGRIHFALDKDFSWDGEDIPAMVVFFKIDGDNAIPLF